MGPVETYLSEMRELRSARAGVKETTYYTALANLLDQVGKTLKPRVRCILQLQNRGAGNPDGGLFTADQFPKGSAEPAGAGIPARGVIEIKSTSEDAWITADGEQVSKYWGRYQPGAGDQLPRFRAGGPRYRRPARSSWKPTAWRAVKPSSGPMPIRPRQNSRRQRRRASSNSSSASCCRPLRSPRRPGLVPGSYAREAKFRIEARRLPAALGHRARRARRSARHEVRGREGRALLPLHPGPDALLRRLLRLGVLEQERAASRSRALQLAASAARYLRVPILRKLFDQVADPGALEPWTCTRCSTGPARRSTGWTGARSSKRSRSATPCSISTSRSWKPSTPSCARNWASGTRPPKIVKYMVARVDTVLREELGVAGRPGRPERLRAGPLLRHRRLSGGGAATGSPRRCARRAATPCSGQDLEGGGDGSRLRLRDSARALRGGAPAVGPAPATLGAPLCGRRRTSGPASSSPTPSPAGSRQEARSSSYLSRDWRRSATPPTT